MSNALQVKELSCQRQQRPVLNKLSFCLNSGQVLLVEGVNGSGKSSLLRLLAGLATPSAGEVLWCGASIFNHADYRRHFHYVGHQNGLKLDLTAKENLVLKAQLQCRARLEDVPALLALLRLERLQDTIVRYLSAGQKRRLALAGLFLEARPLWILDEPLTTLDHTSQEFLLTALVQHLQRGGMCILSSHQSLAVIKERLPQEACQSLRLSPC